MKITILGSGNMGGAIAGGILQSGYCQPGDMTCTARSQATLERLRSLDPGLNLTLDNAAAVKGADMIIMAVKPWKMETVIDEIKGVLDYGKQIIVSVAANVSIADLERMLLKEGDNIPLPVIFRAMPNTAVEVRSSVTFLATRNGSEEHVSAVSGLFGLLGKAVLIEEKLMAAGTALASCGIAFAFRYIRAAMEGGIEMGFSAKDAQEIVSMTVKGAAELLRGTGVNVAFLTGDIKKKERGYLLDALKRGDIDLVIGTHALFSKDVVFRNLQYVIIDEQHRFGVEQRDALSGKGKKASILMMSATPIPRTLALTVYGSMDISTIYTKPHGRKPVITHIVDEKNRERMYQAIGVEFQRGHQAYFVYPRIDDEGDSDLKDVTTMYSFLKTKYPDVPSRLIHSRLSEEEKIEILDEFRERKIMYLVSTSVVEVGIDIPDATCMVIEHAERFGLAALHQLRGRVGRSSLQSYCFLVYYGKLTEEAVARLKVMRQSNDGFQIAETDLKIRGPGEFTGSRQSGFLRLKVASLVNDVELMAQAREDAAGLLASDPGLISEENSMLRIIGDTQVAVS